MKSFENKLNNAKDTIQEIGKDKRLDGSDLSNIQKVKAHIDALSDLKESTEHKEYQKFKKDLLRITKDMLKKGYTVNNDQDYQTVSHLIKMTYPNINLPRKKEIITKTGPNSSIFSLSKEKNGIIFYNQNGDAKAKLTSNGDLEYTAQIFGDKEKNNNLFFVKENIQSKKEGKPTQIVSKYPFLQPNKDTNKPKQASSGQTVTPVEKTKEKTQHLSMKKIRTLDKKQVTEELKNMGLIIRNFGVIKNNKTSTALIQRAAELFKVPSAINYKKGEFIDGLYGESTIAAVKEMQEKLGFTKDNIDKSKRNDGKAGETTIQHIIDKLAGGSSFKNVMNKTK